MPGNLADPDRTSMHHGAPRREHCLWHVDHRHRNAHASLAATPSAIGAIDPFAAFSGLGLGTANATPLPYIIIEYTDSTFSQPKQLEKGFGNLLIGASLTATTLTRNALVTQVIATPSYTAGTFSTPATAITIGTAANTLVFIGPSAWDQAQTLHVYSTSGISSADGLGVCPFMVGGRKRFLAYQRQDHISLRQARYL